MVDLFARYNGCWKLNSIREHNVHYVHYMNIFNSFPLATKPSFLENILDYWSKATEIRRTVALSFQNLFTREKILRASFDLVIMLHTPIGVWLTFLSWNFLRITRMTIVIPFSKSLKERRRRALNCTEKGRRLVSMFTIVQMKYFWINFHTFEPFTIL